MTSPILDSTGAKIKKVPVVAICVPAGDQCATMFTLDLTRLMVHTVIARPDIRLLLYFNKGTIIPESRHKLVRESLKIEELTHILWIDSDMRFPRDALLRLLAHDVPVVAANYATRRLPVTPTAGFGLGELKMYSAPEDTELTPVRWCGSGFMLVEAGLYRAMPAPWYVIGFSKVQDAFAGEDVYFCSRVQDAGLEVLIDPVLSREVSHCGEFEYTLLHAAASRAYEMAGQEVEEAKSGP